MIWITTDSHWNHDNIIEYEDRPADYGRRIIDNWKAVVSPTDTVIHLGDVIFKRRFELRDILGQLPGIKILTVGNHDKRTGTNDWFLRMGFNYVCKSHAYKDILFSHKPLDPADYPGIRHNIHGHFHRNSHNPTDYPFYNTGIHVKVSVEELDYKMVALRDLVGE
jgi:calcineurin-like phosphoesterase family protein